MRFTVLVVAALLTTGCAGIGVVATTDPLAKLNDAEDLLLRQNRPLIAERLIREAITIYQEQSNFHGLGNAHRGYADLIMSPTVSGKWEKFYRDNGFQDKTVTYDNRATKAAEYYVKAIEYYGRAIDEVRKVNRYDLLTNVYYNMAYSYKRIDDRVNACRFYDETLGAYNENIRRNPGVTPFTPTGTVPDLVAAKKKQIGCL